MGIHRTGETSKLIIRCHTKKRGLDLRATGGNSDDKRKDKAWVGRLRSIEEAGEEGTNRVRDLDGVGRKSGR